MHERTADPIKKLLALMTLRKFLYTLDYGTRSSCVYSINSDGPWTRLEISMGTLSSVRSLAMRRVTETLGKRRA